MAAIGEIEHSVGSEERAMQAGCIRRHVPAGEDHFFAAGRAIKSQHIGRRRHVEAAAIPDSAGGKCEVLGENAAGLINAIAIAILEQTDPVIRVGRHLIVVECIA